MLTMSMWVLNYNCTGSFPSSAFQASCLDTNQPPPVNHKAEAVKHTEGCRDECHLCLSGTVFPLIMAQMIHSLKWEHKSGSLKVRFSCLPSLLQTAYLMTNTSKKKKQTVTPSGPPWMWGHIPIMTAAPFTPFPDASACINISTKRWRAVEGGWWFPADLLRGNIEHSFPESPSTNPAPPSEKQEHLMKGSEDL